MNSVQYSRRKRRRRKRQAYVIIISVLLVMVMAGAFYRLLSKNISGHGPGTDPAAPYITIREPATEESAQSGEAQSAGTDQDWNLTLVNPWQPIPQDYEVTLVEVPGGEKVDERIYGPLMEMLEAAKEANLGQLPMVVSGYRTQEKQQELYDGKIAEYKMQGYSEDEAARLAEQWVAVPGYSEHQLGFAVDINGAIYDLYPWLQENSYKYGFIFRYPGSKTDITGIAEEVWHYRYVGVEAATQMYEQGLCLEEYLERLEGK